LKINSLLAGTFALILVTGMIGSAFAQLVGSSSFSSSMIFTPSHGNFDQSFTGPFPQVAFIEPQTIITGQTFTPSASNLVGVDVFASVWPPGTVGGPDTITVNVWDSNQPGSGNLLGTSTVNVNTVGTSALNPILVHLDFSPFQIIPGNTYALEFIAGNAANTLLAASCLDPYPGGILWQSGNAIPSCDFGFVTYFDDDVVGGIVLPIESIALILVGAQSFSWIIPVILSGLGIGLFVVSRKSENS
jgi:hypothetical protein